MLHIGDDQVQKVTTQNLHAEYEAIVLHDGEAIVLRDGEAIEDFALRLALSSGWQLLAIQSRHEGLRKVPACCALKVQAAGHLNNNSPYISHLSIEEVTRRLKVIDDVKSMPPQVVGGKLHTEE